MNCPISPPSSLHKFSEGFFKLSTGLLPPSSLHVHFSAYSNPVLTSLIKITYGDYWWSTGFQSQWPILYSYLNWLLSRSENWQQASLLLKHFSPLNCWDFPVPSLGFLFKIPDFSPLAQPLNVAVFQSSVLTFFFSLLNLPRWCHPNPWH